MTLNRKRWLVIAAGILASACMGQGYAFSVFKPYLLDALKCTSGQVTEAYSLSFLFLPVGMLLARVLSRRFGPRVAVMIGGLLFGLGVCGAGLSHSVYGLYATYGVMVSVGNGITYATVIAAAVRWFPDRKGLASGMVVAALGAGGLIIAPLGQALISRMGVRHTLIDLGAAYAVVALIASRFMVDPPKNYAPEGMPEPEQTAQGTHDVSWTQMLATPVFWLLFVVYVCGASPGLMLIGQAKEVAKSLAQLNDRSASLMAGILGGAASACGRLMWGAVSDRIGRLNSLAAMSAITIVTMLFLSVLATTGQGLVVGFVLVGLCFGGNLGTFPSLCADRFGSRNIEVNYALLFVAFGLAGKVGPWCGEQARIITGGYTGGFRLAAAIALLGLILTLSLKLRLGKKQC